MQSYTKEIQSILKKSGMRESIEKYQGLIDCLEKNISAPSCPFFQDAYCDFFKLRMSREQKKLYFKVFCEFLKTKKDTGNNPSIHLILDGISSESKVWFSYASKMLHCIDQTQPIWDSVLTKKCHFDMRVSYSKCRKIRAKRSVEKYEQYQEKYSCFMKREDGGQILVQEFKKVFPELKISEEKMVDFILWQDRDCKINLKSYFEKNCK